MIKRPEMDESGTLRAINEILGSHFSQLSRVPTNELMRVFLLLSIEAFCMDHPEFSIWMADYNDREDATRQRE